MARNGTGTYNLPAGNPVVTGSTISSTWANNTLNDLATAMTGSIAKDGQTTPTGNLPMGGYAHTGVADANLRTMYGTAGQIQDSAFTFLTSPSGTNTMIATAALGMSAYVVGQRFFFVAPSTNTGACTLNINAIGAKALTKSGTTALSAGDIQSGAVIQIVYDGTQFQMVSPTLTVSSFSGGTTGLTPSSATTGAVTIAGTLAVANGGTGVTTSTGSGANVLGTSPSISGAVLTSMASSVLTLGTSQSSTSGTSIDFTGIPSWVKRITVMFNSVSTNGTSSVQIQVGSGSVQTTGYISSAQQSNTVASSTTGLVISAFNAAADIRIGAVVLTNISGNIWIMQGNTGQSTSTCACSGNVTLSSTLDRVVITTVNGTDAFDAGSINILYE